MPQLCSLQVQGHIKNLIEEHFRSDLDSTMRDPILFGDYRTALKSEPRVYEDILDYDASKALFQVHRCLYILFRFTFMHLVDDFILAIIFVFLFMHYLYTPFPKQKAINISANEQAWQSEAFIIGYNTFFFSLTPVGDSGGV